MYLVLNTKAIVDLENEKYSEKKSYKNKQKITVTKIKKKKHYSLSYDPKSQTVILQNPLCSFLHI